MDQPQMTRMFYLQHRVLEDATCQALLVEFEEANRCLLAALPEMAERHRGAVMDYIGLLGELNQRILELAVMGGTWRLEESAESAINIPGKLMENDSNLR